MKLWPKLHQFYESKFELWFAPVSAFNLSQTLTSRPGIEYAAFFPERVTTSSAIPCPKKQTMKCERSHLKKYWLFYSVLRSFTRTSFMARNPLAFAIEVSNFWVAWCFHSGCQTWQLHGKFSPPWMPVCCLKCNSRGLKHQTGRIGSCKDLPDCSLSHKKWKLFSIVCQELGKLCQLSLTILTHVRLC